MYAVFPPDTHGEVRMQQGPKRRMRIQGLFHARSCVIVLEHVRVRLCVCDVSVRTLQLWNCVR